MPKVVTEYELVKHRFDNMDNDHPMTCEEAHNLMNGTTICIYPYNGKYKWFAIMSECEGFDTPREAFDDALEYLKRGGY